MTLKESYQLHKNKCIKNASRIEAAINQLTNLKNAEELKKLFNSKEWKEAHKGNVEKYFKKGE